jgi:hypothetical protein
LAHGCARIALSLSIDHSWTRPREKRSDGQSNLFEHKKLVFEIPYFQVPRDRIMVEFDRQFPEYPFAQHTGSWTHAHLEALRKQRAHLRDADELQLVVRPNTINALGLIS